MKLEALNRHTLGMAAEAWRGMLNLSSQWKAPAIIPCYMLSLPWHVHGDLWALAIISMYGYHFWYYYFW